MHTVPIIAAFAVVGGSLELRCRGHVGPHPLAVRLDRYGFRLNTTAGRARSSTERILIRKRPDAEVRLHRVNRWRCRKPRVWLKSIRCSFSSRYEVFEISSATVFVETAREARTCRSRGTAAVPCDSSSPPSICRISWGRTYLTYAESSRQGNAEAEGAQVAMPFRGNVLSPPRFGSQPRQGFRRRVLETNRQPDSATTKKAISCLRDSSLR